jgi:hypothetical protein
MSKVKRSKRRGGGPEEGHDEPIVIDNGPISVLMGIRPGHPPRPVSGTQNKRWKRDFTGLSHIVIQQLSASGEVERIVTEDLRTTRSVVFNLTSSAHPEVILDTFPASGSALARIEMDAKTFPWTRASATGRMTQTAGSHLRIERIRGFEDVNGQGNITFATPIAVSENKKVIVVLVAVPE